MNRNDEVVPTVGRSVHYAEWGDQCMAAVITEVRVEDIDAIKLVVFKPEGLLFTPDWLTHDEGHRTPLRGKEPGTWHWAEPAPKRFPDEEPAAPEATV